MRKKPPFLRKSALDGGRPHPQPPRTRSRAETRRRQPLPTISAPQRLSGRILARALGPRAPCRAWAVGAGRDAARRGTRTESTETQRPAPGPPSGRPRRALPGPSSAPIFPRREPPPTARSALGVRRFCAALLPRPATPCRRSRAPGLATRVCQSSRGLEHSRAAARRAGGIPRGVRALLPAVFEVAPPPRRPRHEAGKSARAPLIPGRTPSFS